MEQNTYPLDYAGTFRAEVLQWRLYKSDGKQGIAIIVDFKILGQWNEEAQTYVDWEYAETTISNFFYVIKNDGAVNETAVNQIAEALGWNGALGVVSPETPPPTTVCSITVGPNTYQGKTTMRVNWINPDGHVPGARTIPKEKIAEIEAQSGSLLRAAAMKAKGAGAQPIGRPKPPPRRTPESMVPLDNPTPYPAGETPFG